ncbi:DNA-binding protein H-NS [Oikeobacillus pervagus]|uniref:DNA-binding protein H-NS n=1 Tax=Oikeobacillus pervagus TaxID=1325931 RepID=A0AAJ1SWA7_9BACI|nr:YqkE family protein [Oikeobacillus pervagus]MDQ0213769.1 DNA-binding protein H-NS [Oikeobacillus pervagus]
MKKNKQSRQKKASQQENLTLKDALNSDILEQLKEKQKQLQKEELKRKEEEEEKKREERRQREKNKSFEELLGESNLNWKDYK